MKKMAGESQVDPMDYLVSKGEEFAGHVDRFGLMVEGIIRSIWYNLMMALFTSFTFFVLLLIASPLLITSENPSLRGVGAGMYNLVSFTGMCHQLPQRSIGFFGAHMPVDARSFAIYLGFVLGGILPMATERVPRLLRSFWVLPLSIAPIMLDGFSQTVFVLRESNNVLRFFTGLVFGFGFACFFASYLFRKYRDFKPSITRKGNLFVTLSTTLVILYVVVSSLGNAVGGRYLSLEAATVFALNQSGRTWNFSRAYYVSPHVATSIHYDPYLESYRDYVLTDVRDLDWDRLSVLADESGSRIMGLNGIWAVVLSDDRPVRGPKTVYTNVPGEYYYVDPLYKVVLDVKSH